MTAMTTTSAITMSESHSDVVFITHWSLLLACHLSAEPAINKHVFLAVA